MLTQNFGVTKKEHYGMLWYFLEWSFQFAYCGPKLTVYTGPSLLKNLIKGLIVSYGSDTFPDSSYPGSKKAVF